MITRQEYMNDSNNLHRSYYGQFVNEDVKRMVLNQFPLDVLKESYAKDEHFNDKLTPMKKWDQLGGFAFSTHTGEMTVKPATTGVISNKLLKEAGEGYSSSTAVCIYKEAARQLIENE